LASSSHIAFRTAGLSVAVSDAMPTEELDDARHNEIFKDYPWLQRIKWQTGEFWKNEEFWYADYETKEMKRVPDELLKKVAEKGRYPPALKIYQKDGKEDLCWMGMDHPGLPPRAPISTAAVEFEKRRHAPPPWNEESIRRVVAQAKTVVAKGKVPPLSAEDCPNLHVYKARAGSMPQWTAMWYAAKLNMWDEVHELLDLGADPNAVDEYEFTAMMWAAREGRMDVIGKLVDLGADINAMTQYGFTAYMWAKKYCEEGDETPKHLLTLGAREEIPKPWEAGCPEKYSWTHRRLRERRARHVEESKKAVGMKAWKAMSPHDREAMVDEMDKKETAEKKAEEDAREAQIQAYQRELEEKLEAGVEVDQLGREVAPDGGRGAGDDVQAVPIQ
jgi:hypothetical protein